MSLSVPFVCSESRDAYASKKEPYSSYSKPGLADDEEDGALWYVELAAAGVLGEDSS